MILVEHRNRGCMPSEKEDNMYKHYFNKKRADIFFDRMAVFIVRATVASVIIGCTTIALKLFGVAQSMTWLQACAPLLLYYAVFAICITILAVYSVVEDKRRRKRMLHIKQETSADNTQT